MGYYIDFVFDPETPITRKNIISRLDKAGAVKLKESYCEVSTRSKKTGKIVLDPRRCGLYTDFYYDGLWGGVTVYPREHYHLKGNWMETRTSWGCSPKEIISVWEAAFELAEKVGCWVYDGQKRGFVFLEDINRMARFFFKTASGITKMFGTVRNETTNLRS